MASICSSEVMNEMLFTFFFTFSGIAFGYFRLFLASVVGDGEVSQSSSSDPMVFSPVLILNG